MLVIYKIKYFKSSFNPYQPPIQMERTTQWKSTTESIADWYMVMYFSNVHTKPSSSLLNIVLTSFLGSFNDASRKNRCEQFPIVERPSQTAKRSMAAFYILFGCRSESLFGCLTFNGNERLVLGLLLQRQRWSFLKAWGSDCITENDTQGLWGVFFPPKYPRYPKGPWRAAYTIIIVIDTAVLPMLLFVIQGYNTQSSEASGLRATVRGLFILCHSHMTAGLEICLSCYPKWN